MVRYSAKRLQQEAERWTKMAREEGMKKAEAYYWEKVFPLVKAKFLRENAFLTGRYEGLMLTLGTTPQPIILALEAVRPSRVHFIYTDETEKHIKRIIEEVGFLRDHSVAYDRDRVDPGNPLELYECVGRKWAEWSRGETISCAVCNTGGKKSMVSAAAAAANFLGIDIIYVDHERYLEDLRVPEPGSERLTVLPNPLQAMGELKLRDVRALFNAGNFESARRILEEVGEELSGKQALPVGMTLQVLTQLVEGYRLWDLFHYGSALDKLKKALEMAKRYEVDLDTETISRNVAALEHLSREPRNKSLFSTVRDDYQYGVRLLVDLFCNAERKAEAGFHDDAMVRLYRCLELVAQLRLANLPVSLGGPVNTDDPEWDRMPGDVVQRYVDLSSELYREARRRGRFSPSRPNLPSNLGLTAGHVLLFSLGDPVWKGKSMEQLQNFIESVRKRNELMLVHGKKRAKLEDIRIFRDHAEHFIDLCAQQANMKWDKIKTEHTFVRL